MHEELGGYILDSRDRKCFFQHKGYPSTQYLVSRLDRPLGHHMAYCESLHTPNFDVIVAL